MLQVFDKDVTREVARATPALYKDGLQRVFLNKEVFWGWMFEGMVHSVLVTFLPLYSMGYFNVLANGHTVGLWDYGTLVFLCVLLVASLRLSIEVCSCVSFSAPPAS
jgi:magnesium-transporting ATPase (P-type)